MQPHNFEYRHFDFVKFAHDLPVSNFCELGRPVATPHKNRQHLHLVKGKIQNSVSCISSATNSPDIMKLLCIHVAVHREAGRPKRRKHKWSVRSDYLIVASRL